jgi:thymidylate synthase
MKIFDTVDELWLDLIGEILDNGSMLDSRAGGTLELLGWSGRIADPRACFVFNPHRALPPFYPAAELIWYLSGTMSVDMIKQYAPQYERFANEGQVHGAYGYRWAHDDDHVHTFYHFNKLLNERPFAAVPSDVDSAEALRDKKVSTPLGVVVQMLKKTPNTRQAILTCWAPRDLLYAFAGKKNDIPCTLTIQFLLRDGKLNMITNMRSNDAWLGTPNDIFCFCGLQIIVATMLQVELGWYQHQVGSMHLYDRNMEKAKSARNTVAFDTGPLEFVNSNLTGWAQINRDLVDIEESNRVNANCYKGSGDRLGGDNSFLSQLVFMAASKWTDSADGYINSKLIRKAIERTRLS